MGAEGDGTPHAPCFGPHNLALARAAPRCGARARAGTPCPESGRAGAQPLPDAWRAEYRAADGGREGARVRRASLTHGGRSAEAVAERREAAAIRRKLRRMVRELQGQ